MGYRVSVLAQDAANEAYEKNGVQIHPVKPFGRLSLKRILFSFWIWRKAKEIKADVYVLHAPELLFLGKRLKRITGAKIIYDVHEDYLINISQAKYYPSWLRKRLGNWVRKREKKAVKWLDAVSYAEGIYINMLEVPEGRWFLLENTFTPHIAQSSADIPIPDQPYLLFTGLIAVERGIWESLKLWKEIHHRRGVKLIVAGHCQLPGLVEDVKEWVKRNGLADDFMLIGGYEYVPYVNILKLIEHCWCGLMLYHIIPQIKGKLPTKIFEFMAYDQALIYTDDPIWNRVNELDKIGVSWNEHIDVDELLQRLDAYLEKKIKHQPRQYSWEENEKKLALLMALIEEKQRKNS